MVAYNSEKYIGYAIQSILDQAYDNLELIIIEDGSTDKTLQIINSYKDPRINIIENSNNMGIPFSRNRALASSNGKYIAVLDSDDISLDMRIFDQVEFLENNPSFGLIGGLSELIDSSGFNMNIIQGQSLSSEETMVHLLFKNCFTHSTIMFNKELIKSFSFNLDFAVCEDYELIVKIAQKRKIKNLNKVIIQYRIHNKNITQTNKSFDSNIKKIILSQFLRMGLSVSDKDYRIHKKLSKKNVHHDNTELIYSLEWLEKLYMANMRKKIYPKEEFYNKISGYWFNLINNPFIFNPRLLKPYFQSKILWESNRRTLDHIKFIIKCILFWKTKIIKKGKDG